MENLDLLGDEDAARRRKSSLGIIVGNDFVAIMVVRALSGGSNAVALGGITLNLLMGWGRYTIGTIRHGWRAPIAIHATATSLRPSRSALVGLVGARVMGRGTENIIGFGLGALDDEWWTVPVDV